MRISSLLLFVGLVQGFAQEEWRVYHGDSGGTHSSSLAQINRSNVKDLEPAWIFRTETKGTLQCNPLVVHGLVYLVDQRLRVFALHAATGKVRWEFDPHPGETRKGICRGFSYWESPDGEDRRLFFPSGRFVHALNAKTGKPIESFASKGKLDLREHLNQALGTPGVSLKTPGVIYGDLLILGSNVSEGPGPSSPGHIRAYDVRTGAFKWRFHTIPHPGEVGYETWPPNAWQSVGGANCWGGLTVDQERGMVFFATGSASYDHYGGNRIGKNAFANSVVALEAATGKYKWHFQTVYHDLWDYDLPCQPNLITVRHNGEKIDAVAQSTKMGHIFLLDRETGKPLFPIEERPVPLSDIPGEASWPTQPFPTKPPALAQQRFTEAEATDLNPEATAYVKERLSEMTTGDIFLPPRLKPSVVLPQFNGGGEWGGAAVDAQGIMYVNVSNEAEWISMRPAKPKGEITQGELGRTLYQSICANCHGNPNAQPEGAPPMPPLHNVKERLKKDEVLNILKTGRNQMPSFAALSDAERQSVVAFLYDDETDRVVKQSELSSSWSDTHPYIATGHHDFRDPQGYPVNKRPWGTMNAVDMNLGEILWQVPLGTYPKLEAQGYEPTGTFNIGGPLLTAGGLVFIGAAMDGRFHAFDQETGELLWEYQMEAGGYASPATYEAGGRQFVLIAAGGAGKPGTKPGNAYYAFALPEKVSRVQCEDLEGTIVITRDGKHVLSYQKKARVPEGVDPAYARSGFIHPITTPSGKVLTDDYPLPHHSHQHGLFFAWKKATFKGQAANFWEHNRSGAGVWHHEVLNIINSGKEAGFRVRLVHQLDGEAVLNEIWDVRVEANTGFIDFETTQSCATDAPLKIDRYHYGAMAIRGARAWFDLEFEKNGGEEPCRFLTSEGLTRANGNHSRPNWVAMTGLLEGEPVTFTMMAHPGNFRHPQHVRLHPKMPYFCFTPMVEEGLQIVPGQPYVSRFRILAEDGEPKVQRWEEVYADWADR